MLEFFKLCIIWLIIGLTCAIIGALYDIIINNVYIKVKELKAILILVALGFISVPVTICFLIEDIKENKKHKKKNKKFR